MLTSHKCASLPFTWEQFLNKCSGKCCIITLGIILYNYRHTSEANELKNISSSNRHHKPANKYCNDFAGSCLLPKCIKHWGLHKNRCHFTGFIFKCNILNENVCISIQLSFKIVSRGLCVSITASVLVLAALKLEAIALTHWVRVMHMCVGKLTIIGSDNGLAPGRHQAIIWTNARILLIWPKGTNLNEILIKIHIFSFKKIHFNMSSGKWRPFCLGLNVLTNVEKVPWWHRTVQCYNELDSLSCGGRVFW